MDNVIWRPTDKQAEFLAASENEVLYGGAAGGGKSDALLVDALGLQQRAIAQPHYRALLLRRSFPELRELIDRSREIYPAVIPGAEYRVGDKEWRFPCGAKLHYGYIESEADRFRYQGMEYQYIGWDELTHQASDVAYMYLISRLRTPDPDLRCYLRATTNPGGAGSQWVQSRWRISDAGEASQFADETGWSRRFIPARLADNPHLADSGYRERLQLLSSMDQRALLEGRWDVIEIPGAIYRTEIEACYGEGRVLRLPHDPSRPVETYWDLGMADATAIWFVQSAPHELHIIDYYEASGEGLTHYAQVLQSRGYTYGTHTAPHDIQVRELGTGQSRLEVAAKLGIKFQVAPQLPLEDGIDAARRLFGRCYFDATKCAPGLRALQHYRRDYNPRMGEFKASPVHDWASHGADAFRYLAVSQRPARDTKPIQYKDSRAYI